MNGAGRRPVRWRRSLAATVAGAVVAVSAVAVTYSAAYAVTIDPNAWYQVVSRHSGLALGIAGGSTADQAGLVQTARASQASQQFQFVASGGGYYRVKARHSGKVLDVYDFSTADGANVVQWSDLNGANQQWSVTDSISGYVKLVNRNSGKALDVWEWSTSDGGRISQYTDTGGTNQQWQLVNAGTGTPTATPTTRQPGTPPASYPNPGRVTGSTGAHDPAVVKAANGTYIVVTTGDNLPIKTSTDRTAWQNAGVVWPNGASWTTPYTNGGRSLWAPDISYRNGQFYLYYSASTFGSQRSAIFLATSPTGAAGSWTNQGLVIESSSSVNYNAIDPNLVVDDAGQWWLSFGSFWTGIKMIRLDPGTGRRSTSDTAVRAVAQRTTAGGAVEAPFIYKHGSYYYMFVSFDRCCQGASSTYRVMVGRSTSVTGPYTDRDGVAMTAGGGTEILAGHGSIHGPGHQAVLGDSDGDVLFYHYYADSGASFLGINLIGWDAANWPYVY
ncbi:family 43 glycosylhydrolase [Phytohabitans sp. ZYX-F-186]|uniref:Family 43 glycosylhydrolase n=1 Tax=Phytohabitans maris TaxID=3071409 RepID=A0ABU0ZZD4_9ACTN|nr:family 43 glycosylhydrolase [Phytohabitans sp. ZYX-F-186]MDQ7911332.1 family 43 glycosylhydrolase [Phytohabitans sp. ZYX-F-186]